MHSLSCLMDCWPCTSSRPSHVSVRYRRIIPVRDPTSISAPVREKLLTPKEISTQEKVAALRSVAQEKNDKPTWRWRGGGWNLSSVHAPANRISDCCIRWIIEKKKTGWSSRISHGCQLHLHFKFSPTAQLVFGGIEALNVGADKQWLSISYYNVVTHLPSLLRSRNYLFSAPTPAPAPPLSLISAPAPAIYCHLKLFYNSSTVR